MMTQNEKLNINLAELINKGYDRLDTIEDKNIILLNSPLQLDPIKKYFNTHPDTYSKWKKENGEYTYRKSRIIFEWR